MQYTSKLAILALALFSTSALAAPFASFGSELEVREVDNELSAREFFDAYLEAREDPSLNARNLEALDMKAREYLEMRDLHTSTHPSASTSSNPSASTSSKLSGSSGSPTRPKVDLKHPHFSMLNRNALNRAHALGIGEADAFEEAFLTKPVAQGLYLYSVQKVYHQALLNPNDPLHSAALHLQAYLNNKRKEHSTAPHAAPHAAPPAAPRVAPLAA